MKNNGTIRFMSILLANWKLEIYEMVIANCGPVRDRDVWLSKLFFLLDLPNELHLPV